MKFRRRLAAHRVQFPRIPPAADPRLFAAGKERLRFRNSIARLVARGVTSTGSCYLSAATRDVIKRHERKKLDPKLAINRRKHNRHSRLKSFRSQAIRANVERGEGARSCELELFAIWKSRSFFTIECRALLLKKITRARSLARNTILGKVVVIARVFVRDVHRYSTHSFRCTSQFLLLTI